MPSPSIGTVGAIEEASWDMFADTGEVKADYLDVRDGS